MDDHHDEAPPAEARLESMVQVIEGADRQSVHAVDAVAALESLLVGGAAAAGKGRVDSLIRFIRLILK